MKFVCVFLLCLHTNGMYGYVMSGFKLTREGLEVNFDCAKDEVICRLSPSDCIKKVNLCDGNSDCPHGTDEDYTMCTARCMADDKIECPRTGTCISRSEVCNGISECSDKWDEHDCCGPSGFSCESEENTCVPKGWTCDKRQDCSNGLDESPKAGCACDRFLEFTCADLRKCIKMSERCNSVRDCLDGSDELGCSSSELTSTLDPLFPVDSPYKTVDLNSELPDFTASGEIPTAEDSGLVFDLRTARPVYDNRGGTLSVISNKTWLNLEGKGYSFANFVAPPCSVGVPHYHPFSDEIVIVIRGSKATAGFKNPREPLQMVNGLKAGQIFIAPKGSIHFFINNNCEDEVEAILIWPDDEKHITMTIAEQINALPDEILHAGLNIDIDEVQSIKEMPITGIETLRISQFCLQRCGLQQL